MLGRVLLSFSPPVRLGYVKWIQQIQGSHLRHEAKMNAIINTGSIMEDWNSSECFLWQSENLGFKGELTCWDEL